MRCACSDDIAGFGRGLALVAIASGDLRKLDEVTPSGRVLHPA